MRLTLGAEVRFGDGLIEVIRELDTPALKSWRRQHDAEDV